MLRKHPADPGTINDYTYQNFLQQIVESDTIWSLKSNNGHWACASSTLDPDHRVLPIWSDAISAEGCSRQKWSGYQPEAISLYDFIKQWIAKLNEEEMAIKVYLENNQRGQEVAPMDLLQDLQRVILIAR